MNGAIKSAIGIIGTAVAAVVPEKAAQVFAGLGTGIFMFTQTVIAIRNHRRKTRRRPVWMKKQ